MKTLDAFFIFLLLSYAVSSIAEAVLIWTN